MRPLSFASLAATTLATTLAAALALATTGCVTRTVYVVDDDARTQSTPPVAAGVAAVPAEAAPSGGAYAVEDQAGISDESDFYEPLSPYGSWVVYPGYGRVFVPDRGIVGAGFRPYTHGHWERTEWGWTWVDHHPFGWATGHYGRWFYDSSYGWVWVPGRTWSPAWVTWRSGGSYVGWAPMPPGSYYGASYSVYDTSWVFVSYSGFGYGYVGDYLIVGPGYRTCFVSTSPYYTTYVVYGRTYYRGPTEDEVQSGGGRVVHRPVRDVERERPVTRPPEGTAIARSRDRSRNNDPGGSSRGRDTTGRDDVAANGRDRADSGRDPSDDNNSNGSGRDRASSDNNSNGSGRGRDDARTGDDGNGNGSDPRGGDRGRDGERSSDVVSNDPRGLPDRIGATGDDVRGTDGRAGGDVRDPRGADDRSNGRALDPRDSAGYPWRGDIGGTVIEPRPIVVGDDGVPDATPNPRDARGERSTRVDARPDLGTVGNDSRSPYIDNERPTKQYPENPDRFRDVTPPTTRGTYERSPTVDPRGTPSVDRSYDRGSPSTDRAPTTSRPVGPSIDRGPAPSRTPSVGSGSRAPSVSQPAVSQPSQPSGEASTPTNGKSSKGKGKATSKSTGKATPKK